MSKYTQEDLDKALDQLMAGPIGQKKEWQWEQSARQKGVKPKGCHSEEARKKATKSNTGQKRPNTSSKMMGVPKSEQAKKNMRKPKGGKNAKGTRKKHLFVSIDKFTSDGEYIKTYPSIIDAVNSNDVTRANLTGALGGRQKTAGGYIWKYVK